MKIYPDKSWDRSWTYFYIGAGIVVSIYATLGYFIFKCITRFI